MSIATTTPTTSIPTPPNTATHPPISATSPTHDGVDVHAVASALSGAPSGGGGGGDSSHYFFHDVPPIAEQHHEAEEEAKVDLSMSSTSVSVPTPHGPTGHHAGSGSLGGSGSGHGRRDSLSSVLWEGATEAQVAGLKALITRKNGEIDAYKAKLEETAKETARAHKALKDRITALEEERDEERQKAQALDETVERVRREKAAVEESHVASTGTLHEQEVKEVQNLRDRLAETEKARAEQDNKILEMESELRALRQKQQHSQEEEKSRWSDLAKEKASAASSARKVAELEAQVCNEWIDDHTMPFLS